MSGLQARVDRALQGSSATATATIDSRELLVELLQVQTVSIHPSLRLCSRFATWHPLNIPSPQDRGLPRPPYMKRAPPLPGPLTDGYAPLPSPSLPLSCSRLDWLQRGETDAFVRICDASKASSPAAAGWPNDPAVRTAMELLHGKGKGKARIS